MTKKTLTIKQICAIFIALIPALKLISAPSIMAEFCKEKLWFPPLLLCILDLVLIFLLLIASKKHNYQNSYDILCKTYSKGFAKVVFFIWAIFFLLKAFIPLLEHKHLIERSFYETLQKMPIFLPFFAICFYVCLKGLKAVGRVCQILAPFSIIALIVLFYLSISPGDYKTLLPIFNINLKSGAIGALNACLWFNDAVYLIFFTSSPKGENKPFLKLAVCYLIPFIMTVTMFIMFYAIFSSIAVSQQLAMSSMSIFSLTLVNIGRFDHLAVFILSLCLVVAISLPILCSVKCICFCFDLKSKLIPAIVINIALLVFTLIFGDRYRQVLDFYFKYITPFIFACGYLLPLLLLGGRKNDLQKI